MKLWEIARNMGITSGCQVSFVGAGGKTSAMLKLAEHWANQGEKVLVTTTTHMEHPASFSGNGMVEKEADEILKEIQEKGWTIAGKASEHPEKIVGIDEWTLKYLREKMDKVLIEADGSKRYPMKVPAENEPVIEDGTTHIFIMAGASAMGKPMGKVCFRLKEAEKILAQAMEKKEDTDSEEAVVTVKIMGELLEEGYVKKLKKAYPEKKLAVILNQADILEEPEKIKEELEAMVSVPVFLHSWEKSVHMVVLAAGFSKRFGGNKLLYELDGMPMYQHLLNRLKELKEEGKTDSLLVVSQYEEILEEIKKQGIPVVKNEDSARGISSSLQLGLEKTIEIQKEKEEHYYMFFAADQPWLGKETIREFTSAFLKSNKKIGCVSKDGVPKNPVIFHQKYIPELMSLTGDTGGKKVLKKHLEETFFYEVQNEKELFDCDYKSDIQGKQ